MWCFAESHEGIDFDREKKLILEFTGPNGLEYVAMAYKLLNLRNNSFGDGM